jgi:hypothetical protein
MMSMIFAHLMGSLLGEMHALFIKYSEYEYFCKLRERVAITILGERVVITKLEEQVAITKLGEQVAGNTKLEW